MKEFAPLAAQMSKQEVLKNCFPYKKCQNNMDMHPWKKLFHCTYTIDFLHCFVREMGGLLILITWLGVSRFTDIGR